MRLDMRFDMLLRIGLDMELDLGSNLGLDLGLDMWVHIGLDFGLGMGLGMRRSMGPGSRRNRYDAVMLYAHAATKVLSEGGDVKDGLAMTDVIRRTSFIGIANTVVALDEKGDRIEDYEVANYVLTTDGVMEIVTVGVFNNTLKKYYPSAHAIVWPNGSNDVPRDVACQSGQSYIEHPHECRPCIRGTFQPGNETLPTSCWSCPPGSFSENSGSSTCTICPPGTYSADSASYKCQKCDYSGLERYQPNAGMSRCEVSVCADVGMDVCMDMSMITYSDAMISACVCICTHIAVVCVGICIHIALRIAQQTLG